MRHDGYGHRESLGAILHGRRCVKPRHQTLNAHADPGIAEEKSVELDEKTRTQRELPLETDADASFPIYHGFAVACSGRIQTRHPERSPQ
jgi:hypothetical protein